MSSNVNRLLISKIAPRGEGIAPGIDFSQMRDR